MAGKNDPFPAQLRGQVVAHFVAAIQAETDPVRKQAMEDMMAPFQASLVGMTGAEASAAVIQFIKDLKAL
jgi:hypothetical protein